MSGYTLFKLRVKGWSRGGLGNVMGLYTYLFMTSEKGLIFINVLQNKNVNPEPACLWMFFFLPSLLHSYLLWLVLLTIKSNIPTHSVCRFFLYWSSGRIQFVMDIISDVSIETPFSLQGNKDLLGWTEIQVTNFIRDDCALLLWLETGNKLRHKSASLHGIEIASLHRHLDSRGHFSVHTLLLPFLDSAASSTHIEWNLLTFCVRHELVGPISFYELI